MKFIKTTLFVLCCMLVNSAWSGQGEEVNIVIEKNAAGEEILEINGERVNLSEELENLDADLHGLLKELKFLGGKGKPDQAFIGILLEQEDPDAAGVNVIGITPDSPAQKAGLKAGDLITAINDTSLAGDAQKSPGKKLLLELQQLKAGEELELELIRDNREISVSLVAANRADHLRTGMQHLEELEREKHKGHGSHLGSSLAGVELYPMDEELGAYFGTDSGMLILRAPSDKNLPLQTGDVILRIGERTPASPSQTWRILASYDKGESLKLTLMRHGEQVTVTLVKP